MRTLRRRFPIAIIATAALLVTGDAFGAGSAAVFHAISPTDEPYIYHNGSYLWNADGTYFRYIIADLGVSTATSMSVTVRGDTQGYAATGTYSGCWINARRLSDAHDVEGSFSGTTTFPGGFYTMTVSISGLPSGQYAFELECALGHIVSGYAGEQIWAWY